MDWSPSSYLKMTMCFHSNPLPSRPAATDFNQNFKSVVTEEGNSKEAENATSTLVKERLKSEQQELKVWVQTAEKILSNQISSSIPFLALGGCLFCSAVVVSHPITIPGIVGGALITVSGGRMLETKALQDIDVNEVKRMISRLDEEIDSLEALEKIAKKKGIPIEEVSLKEIVENNLRIKGPKKLEMK